MKLRSIEYYFKESFSSLLKNRLMTVASIATVAACIFIISLSCCIIANLNSVLGQIENNIGVVVFLDADLTSDEVAKLQEEILAIDHIKMATFVSSEEALEKVKEQWDAEEILDGFDNETNPLSQSFEIDIDNIEYQKEVVAKLGELSGIKYIRNLETDSLLRVNKIVSIVGIVIILILAIISVGIIMNTIKISVYTRRTEINIMKFVGATDWFIRWPFIIDGIIIGVIGAAIPMIISWPMYAKSIELLYTHFTFIKNVATLLDGYTIFSRLIPVSLLAGILLGVTGSVVSIRKHLKV